MVNVSLKLGEMLVIAEALEVVNKNKSNFLNGLNKLAAENIIKKFRSKVKRKINREYLTSVLTELKK